MYKVIFDKKGLPIVMNKNNKIIPKARIHRITFPYRSIRHAKKIIYIIDGPGKAAISIGGKHYICPLGKGGSQ